MKNTSRRDFLKGAGGFAVAAHAGLFRLPFLPYAPGKGQPVLVAISPAAATSAKRSATRRTCPSDPCGSVVSIKPLRSSTSLSRYSARSLISLDAKMSANSCIVVAWW